MGRPPGTLAHRAEARSAPRNLLLEPVAHLWYGQDMPGLAAVGFDLVAELEDVRLDGAGRRVVYPSPHLAQQLVPRHHGPARRHERHEQAVLLVREGDRRPVPHDDAAV